MSVTPTGASTKLGLPQQKAPTGWPMAISTSQKHLDKQLYNSGKLKSIRFSFGRAVAVDSVTPCLRHGIFVRQQLLQCIGGSTHAHRLVAHTVAPARSWPAFAPGPRPRFD